MPDRLRLVLSLLDARPLIMSACAAAAATMLGGTASAVAQCSWSALDTGMSEAVNAVAVMPNGDVIVGGANGFGSGSPTAHIARWNGVAWSALGAGLNGSVGALAVLLNGDLVAAGQFSGSGTLPLSNIGRWDGFAWSAMGPGLNAFVSALATGPNGELYAGGGFDLAGGVPGRYDVGQWTGSAWVPLGVGLRGAGGYIYDLVVRPNGEVIAGGDFTSSSGVPLAFVARWTGTTWAPLGTGLDNSVNALTLLHNGDVIAAGDFTMAGGTPAAYVARWNGLAWSGLGSGIQGSSVFSTFGLSLATLAGGDLVVGGLFTGAGGVSARSIARWNGSTWSGLGGGVEADSTQNQVRSITALPNGDFVAGGLFVRAGGVPARNVARYSFAGGVCPPDFNCSGTVTVQDIFDFLAAFFAADQRTDFNQSGAISVQDIFDFLAAYFAGCS